MKCLNESEAIVHLIATASHRGICIDPNRNGSACDGSRHEHQEERSHAALASRTRACDICRSSALRCGPNFTGSCATPINRRIISTPAN
jgi:hypothetical protein